MYVISMGYNMTNVLSQTLTLGFNVKLRLQSEYSEFQLIDNCIKLIFGRNANVVSLESLS